MLLENYSQKRIIAETKSVVSKYLDLSNYSIFFFGSRVIGNSKERTEDNRSINLATINNIKDDLENIKTLYKTDLVGFKKVSSKFYNESKKNIVTIYSHD